jgi:predicted O-methyltransferase YrrM
VATTGDGDSFRLKVAKCFDGFPYVRDLRREIAKGGLFPAGHHHSPVPDHQAIERLTAERCGDAGDDLEDIDLNVSVQLEMLERWVPYYRALRLPAKQRPDYRYWFEQDAFSYADGIFLHCLLRDLRPRRVIEIGAGFSSALMLDTAERALDRAPDFTFIDPVPDRLLSLLRPGDLASVRIVDRPVQELPPTEFRRLGEGDLLFVDSSHVIKFGNDLHALFSRVLPALPEGCVVCFHDIFYPFEYPASWLRQGRYWNEAYLLRAFLSGNRHWEILLFGDYLTGAHKRFFDVAMPMCLLNTGGSLYLRKRRQPAGDPATARPSAVR